MVFALPIFLACTLCIAAILSWAGIPNEGILLLSVGLGSIQLLTDTLKSLLRKQFALDYIALCAITSALLMGEYGVAAVIALMLSGGNALERYGFARATRALTALKNRIPNTALLADTLEQRPIDSIAIGQSVLVRTGEIIPLDGLLVSKYALIDESSLTGEARPQEKEQNNLLSSGTLNAGPAIVLCVTKKNRDSTYTKLLHLVTQAQAQKSPLIRLADRYSIFFTLCTAFLCALTYVLTGDLSRVLAILVLATPCPLILATPIALLGGVSAAGSKRIIIKRLESLEILSRVRALVFDKTGTLTLGKPVLSDIVIQDARFSYESILKIAYTLEQQSLHPYAKAIMTAAKSAHITPHKIHSASETVGKGVRGTINGRIFSLASYADKDQMAIGLWRDDMLLALLYFQDEVKKNAVHTLKKLQQQGLHLSLYTGDDAHNTQRFLHKLQLIVDVHAGVRPKEKQQGIKHLQQTYGTTVMIGDGINDAPALASADCGIVFAKSEQSASSEAADIILLHGDIGLVDETLQIAHRTLQIAKQGIWFGIGLSIIGMTAASFGYIPALYGAYIQEGIDLLVILAALRASR